MGMVDPGDKGKEALLAAAKQKGRLAGSSKAERRLYRQRQTISAGVEVSGNPSE